MFRKIGTKIDEWIWRFNRWNNQRIWGRVLGYLYTKRQIKKKRFEDDKHFKNFIERVRYNKFLSERQIKKAEKLYKEVYKNEEI